jgi:DNA polymerase V
VVVPLVRPSADTTELTSAALKGLKSFYQPGYQLAKAGVMLLDLVPDSRVQGALLWDEPLSGQRDRSRLMEALDQVNGRFGKRTLLLGSSGMDQGADTWGMKQVRRTPRYTTDWYEVPVARA